METCLCDWQIACHYQPCCTPKDENPQVNHTRAVKEYDRSAADKVKGIFHSSFFVHLFVVQMHSVEKYHLLTIIDYLLAVLFTL